MANFAPIWNYLVETVSEIRENLFRPVKPKHNPKLFCPDGKAHRYVWAAFGEQCANGECRRWKQVDE